MDKVFNKKDFVAFPALNQFKDYRQKVLMI